MVIKVNRPQGRSLDIEGARLVTKERFIYATIWGYRIVQCDLYIDADIKAQGFAFCSPKDQFVRKEGRNIARGRAFKALLHKGSFLASPQVLQDVIPLMSVYLG